MTKNEKGKRIVDTCKCMSPNDGLCMGFNLCKRAVQTQEW